MPDSLGGREGHCGAPADTPFTALSDLKLAAPLELTAEPRSSQLKKAQSSALSAQTASRLKLTETGMIAS
jgi:hypothetical protein